ncbi:Alpha/Beta hydrolase protein [Pterulicium gracile]|uniref:Alpha/Beta hydrolase protein n=1 Tax=Pterulicium gracile TaxID=1884261 RepID=A0A5C3R1R5_9AGAR|nr:Alpha/Beta hydrolase protein [Pterula gracilis]
MGSLFSLMAGYPNPSAVHFPTTSAFPKRRVNGDRQSTLSLEEFVRMRCPSVLSEFKPAWWLWNGDMQTLYSVLGNFTKVDTVTYARTHLRLKDGGTIGLDFTPVEQESIREDAPIIVVLHGLTGGSYEAYVRGVLYPACKPVEQGGLGYRAVVVNYRGCAGVPLTSPQLYSAGHTDDIRQALMYIAHTYPKAPLVGVGFSLGANVLIRYLGEEGTSSRLLTGCALACPWNLSKNSNALSSTFIGRHVYSRGMGSNLLNLLKKHIPALTGDPSSPTAVAVTKALQLRRPTLQEFDGAITRLLGGSSPPFPFETAEDYYAWGASDKIIGDVKVPLLTVNAGDDPVVQEVPMLAGGNSSTVVVVTPHGGHLGWFESTSFNDVTRWITRPVLEWLRAAVEDLDMRTDPAQLYVDDNGFLCQRDREDLGCKVTHEFKGKVIQGANVKTSGVLQGL